MKECSVPIILRPMQGEDRPFVASSWIKSAADLPVYRWVPRVVYMGHYAPIVDQLLSNYLVTVAAFERDPAELVGYICRGSQSVVHYIYVKESVRRLGVAYSLMIHRVSFADMREQNATHWSESCESICRKHPSLRYCPSLLGLPRRRQSHSPTDRHLRMVRRT